MLRANHVESRHLGISVVLMDEDEEVAEVGRTSTSPHSSSAEAASGEAADSESGNGDARHICSFPGCGRTYARREHLKRHLKIHEGGAVLACRICGRRFHRKDHLKHHELAHTDDRPYLCAEPGCGRTYRQRCSLSQHQRSSGHTGKVDRRVQQLQAQKAEEAAAAAMAAAASVSSGYPPASFDSASSSSSPQTSPSSVRRALLSLSRPSPGHDDSINTNPAGNPNSYMSALRAPASKYAAAAVGRSRGRDDAASAATADHKGREDDDENSAAMLAASRAAAAAVATLNSTSGFGPNGTINDWEMFLGQMQSDGNGNIQLPTAQPELEGYGSWVATTAPILLPPPAMSNANMMAHGFFPRDMLLQVTAPVHMQTMDPHGRYNTMV